MTKIKLVIAYIVQNEEFWMPLSLKSVLPVADKIIIIDGFSKDKTLEKIDEFNDERIEIHSIRYKSELKTANGKQRNEYIKILKEKYPDYWCLVLDADEIVNDNFYMLKKALEKAETDNFTHFDIHMEHFIWNLSLVDSISERHYVPRRLFKVSDVNKYPTVEHPILSVNGQLGKMDMFTIFHYGYLNGVKDVMKKYHNHIKKSNIHSKEFLDSWKICHVLGSYPVKEYTGTHPKVIKDFFGI